MLMMADGGSASSAVSVYHVGVPVATTARTSRSMEKGGNARELGISSLRKMASGLLAMAADVAAPLAPTPPNGAE